MLPGANSRGRKQVDRSNSTWPDRCAQGTQLQRRHKWSLSQRPLFSPTSTTWFQELGKTLGTVLPIFSHGETESQAGQGATVVNRTILLKCHT